MVGIERNVDYVTVAVSNLSQNCMSMRTQLTNYLPQVFQQTAESQYLRIPNKPEPLQRVQPAPAITPIVFEYNDGTLKWRKRIRLWKELGKRKEGQERKSHLMHQVAMMTSKA